MMTSTLPTHAALCAAAATVLLASAAHAQKAAAPAVRPAAAAGPAVTWGAPIAGLCVFSREQALGASSAGKSAANQLKALTDQANAAMTPEASAIKTEQQAIRSQASSLTPAALQQRSSALADRIRAYEQNVQSRNRQISQAQTTAIGQMETQMDTILPGLVTSHRCAIIVERGGTYGANPAMDLTPEVIAQLDQRLPNVSVTLPAATAR